MMSVSDSLGIYVLPLEQMGERMTDLYTKGHEPTIDEVLFDQQQHTNVHACACVVEYCEVCSQFAQLVENFELQSA